MLHSKKRKLFVMSTAFAFLVAGLLFGIFATQKNVDAASNNTYSENGYSIQIIDNSNVVSNAIKNEVVRTYFDVYPSMVSRYNNNAQRHTVVTFDPNYTGAAYANGGQIVFSANYIASYPSETSVIIHETMHNVQSYPNYGTPWLIEGIAEYARYYYSPAAACPAWTFGAYSSSHNYDGSYQITGRFLAWLSINVNSRITEELDWRLRSNVFSAQSWVDITGKTVQQLWSQYAANPALTPVAQTSSNTRNVVIYKDSNYGGTSATLAVGNYNLSQLQSKGFANDDLSSIRVPFGFKVTLYWDNNFSGATKVVYGDNSYIGNDWNDKMSSIKVEKAQYRIVSKHSGLVLDIENAGAGVNVLQWEYNGGNWQKWEFTLNNDDTYTIKSVHNGRVLDVTNWSTANGGNLQVWDNGNQANQKWFVTYTDAGYFFINKNSNKSIDVADWSTTKGTNVHQWDYFAQSNQLWGIERVN